MLLPRVRPFTRLFGRTSHFHTSNALWTPKKVLKTFNLADIGEGITECEVITWSVKPQGTMQAFDPLCEVQSDKASVEITSPFDGTMHEILVKEGEVAKVGQALCLIEVESDEEVEAASPPSHQEQEKVTTAPKVDVAPIQNHTPTERKLHPLDPNNMPSPSGNSQNVLATPAVRHFARQKGVDLGLLAPGSGRDGRVEKRDIEVYLAKGSTAGDATVSEAVGKVEDDVVVELGRTRYGMWKAMEKSLEIPHFGYSTSLDITDLHNMLPLFNQHVPAHFLPPPTTPPRPQAVSQSALYPVSTPPNVPAHSQITRLTYLPILLKTLSRAMLEWPLFRSSINPSFSTPSGKPSVTIRPHADISIALSTPTGLYTPTLPAVNTHTVYGIASQLAHLAHLARQTPCGLTNKEMPRRGGTLTVSNVGAIGAGEGAMPVLVPGGGVAIVALGRARWVWDVERGDGSGERRLKVNLGWAADHRVVEGAELAAFVECWRTWAERPERLIVDSV